MRENKDEGLEKARNKNTIEINSMLTNGDLPQKIGAKEITRKTKKNVIPNEKFDGSLFNSDQRIFKTNSIINFIVVYQYFSAMS